MKLSELKPGHKQMCTFKGASGSGKTIAAFSYPKPMYIFNIDDRLDPIFKMYGESNEIFNQVETNKYDEFPPLKTKFESLVNDPKHGGFETIVIDGLTFLADMSIQFSRKISGDTKGKKKGDVWIPGLEDYGTESTILTSIAMGAKLLKCNFILTAHLAIIDVKPPEGDAYTDYVLMTGGKKIGGKLPGLFNEEYYFTTEAPISVNGTHEYVAYTGSIGPISAKTALNLPKRIEWTGKNFYKEMQRLMSITKQSIIEV